MALFSVHFDGPITVNHRVSLRVLSRTYEHMQRAIDRAYLINAYGNVWKHARLTDVQYAETEFLAEYPREGGIILDSVRDGAGAIVDRINAAVRPLFEEALAGGLAEQDSLSAQLVQRRNYVDRVGENTPTFEAIEADPPAQWADRYSNRSIVKEVDQLVNQVTPQPLEGSTIELTFQGTDLQLPMLFDNAVARRFHRLAAERELAAPMIVSATIRSLDRGNRYSKPKAKIVNIHTFREVVLHLSGENDFLALHPLHNGEVVQLYVCPMVEAGGFDLNGGDLYFLAVA